MKSNEENQQCAVITWAKLQENIYPELWLLHHIPNGGKRHIGVAKKMKAAGQKAGVPDLFLPVARKGRHGLYIEMKAEEIRPKSNRSKGGVSDIQREWLNRLRDQNYEVRVCYGSIEAIETIKEYLGIQL